MYLHCHTKNCGWSQDDFWDTDGYTPFRHDLIDIMKKHIFMDKVYMDSSFFSEYPEIPSHKDETGCYCRGTDLVAWNLERKAKNIRSMTVRTLEEWKTIRDTFKCPLCGSGDGLDVD